MTEPNPQECLAATRFIDAESDPVREQVHRLDLADDSPTERAIALFNLVRDSIAYDFTAPATPDAYRASIILASKQGHCVRKSVLLCALARAAAVPAALVFADLRDHTWSPDMVKLMGTDTLHHHGLVAFHLDGRWLKADPTTEQATAKKKGFRLVEFDGAGDALGHETTQDGRPHLEYAAFHGMHPDLPYVEVMESLAKNYARANAKKFRELGLTTADDFAKAAKA